VVETFNLSYGMLRDTDSEGTPQPPAVRLTVISNVRRTFLCATQCAHFAVRRTVHCAHSMLSGGTLSELYSRTI
jgi:hypothetical protein